MASSKSLPGVRMVTASGRPPTRIQRLFGHQGVEPDLAAIVDDPGPPTWAVMGMSATFPDRYGEAMGLDITETEMEAVLDLARLVAHGSQRRFAPLSTFLAGQFVAERARPGLSRAEALAEAIAIAERTLAPSDACQDDDAE